MKITFDFAIGQKVHYTDSLTITAAIMVAGDRILATPVLDHGQLVWKDNATDRLIGAITVEEGAEPEPEPECEHVHTRPDPDSDEWLCDDCGQRIFSP